MHHNLRSHAYFYIYNCANGQVIRFNLFHSSNAYTFTSSIVKMCFSIIVASSCYVVIERSFFSSQCNEGEGFYYEFSHFI